MREACAVEATASVLSAALGSEEALVLLPQPTIIAPTHKVMETDIQVE
jgi:hypothetical protein